MRQSAGVHAVRSGLMVAVAMLGLLGCGGGTPRQTDGAARQAIPSALASQLFANYPKEMVERLFKPAGRPIAVPFAPQTGNGASTANWNNVPRQSALSTTAKTPLVVPGPQPQFPDVGHGYFTAINNLGDAVGVRGEEGDTSARSFYWHANGGGVEFDLWPLYTWTTGINDDGVVVGSTYYPPDIPASARANRPFMWDRSTGMTLLEILPHDPRINGSRYDPARGVAWAVNKNRLVAGSSSYEVCPHYTYEWDPVVCAGNPSCPCLSRQVPCNVDNHDGVLFQGGHAQDLGSIPPQTVTFPALDYQCGRLQATAYQSSSLLAINSLGHPVGWSTKIRLNLADASYPVIHEYRAWAPGTYGDINPPGAFQSVAEAINDHDQIVGLAFEAQASYPYAVLWDHGHAIRLAEMAGVSYGDWYREEPYWRGSIATAINNSGYIAGTSWAADGVHGSVRKPDGTLIDLGGGAVPHAINDRNQVVGAVIREAWDGTTYSYPAVWDLGSEEIVVEVSVDNPEVRPVVSRYFNALTQDWEGTRYDLIDTKVRVYKRGSSTPVPNATLVLSSIAQDGIGGHTKASHGGVRPNGTFWLPGQDPNAVAGVRDSITVPVSAIEAIYPYLTSGVSGTERLTATVTASGQTATASVDIKVQYTGLEGMARSGRTYDFTNQDGVGSQRHGNVNNYLQPAFAKRVQAAFQRYFDKVPAANRFLDGATKFAITEASLKLGGLLDVGQTAWRNPHMTHRTGTDMDVWYATVADDAKFADACDKAHIRCQVHCNLGGTDLTGCPLDSQRHYHLLP